MLQVNVTVELGKETTALLSSLLGGASAKATPKAATRPAAQMDVVGSEDETEKTATNAPAARPTVPAAARPAVPARPAASAGTGMATTAAPAAPARPAAPAAKAPEVPFAELDEEGKLNGLQKLITAMAKKGFTGDIKELLAIYGVAKVTVDIAEYFDTIYEVLNRVKAGEKVADIYA